MPRKNSPANIEGTYIQEYIPMNHDSENIMKKVLVAVMGYVVFLMIGAVVFLSFEQPAESAKCQAATEKLQSGLVDFGNLYFYKLGMNKKLCDGIDKVQDRGALFIRTK